MGRESLAAGRVAAADRVEGVGADPQRAARDPPDLEVSIAGPAALEHDASRLMRKGGTACGRDRVFTSRGPGAAVDRVGGPVDEPRDRRLLHLTLDVEGEAVADPERPKLRSRVEGEPVARPHAEHTSRGAADVADDR